MKVPSFIRFAEFLRPVRFPATLYQRVLAKLIDGVQPRELAGEEREAARKLIGNVDVIPESVRAIVAIVKGRAAGLSRLAALRLLYLALTVDLSRLSEGEQAFIFCGGPKLRLARVCLRYALAAARLLQNVVIGSETADSFTIVRPDGHRVVFETLPASRGGDAGRGVSIVAACLDESAFYFSELDAIANDMAIFGALTPRLLPGGQILIVSSPWAENGLLHTEFTKNWAAPRTSLAIHAPTGLLRAGDRVVEAMIARERERDPENALREFDGQFLPSGAHSFFDRESVAGAIDHDLKPARSGPAGVRVCAAFDLGLVRDFSAAVILHVVENENEDDDVDTPDVEVTEIRVAELLELRPRKGQPLSLKYVSDQFAELCARHGVKSALADNVQLSELQRHLGERVQVTGCSGSQAFKIESFSKFRELLRTPGVVRIPGPYSSLLSEQLSQIVAVPSTGGGIHIRAPRGRAGHCDLTSALVLAAWQATQEAWSDDDDDRAFLRIPARTAGFDHRYASDNEGSTMKMSSDDFEAEDDDAVLVASGSRSW